MPMTLTPALRHRAMSLQNTFPISAPPAWTAVSIACGFTAGTTCSSNPYLASSLYFCITNGMNELVPAGLASRRTLPPSPL
jgi:hypothetical protein